MYLNIVCDSSQISGIHDIAPNNVYVSVFPNPSDAVMNIISHDPKDMIVEVVDLDGRLAETIDLPAYSSQTIHKSNNISTGMYLLNYYDASGTYRMKTQKVTFY